MGEEKVNKKKKIKRLVIAVIIGIFVGSLCGFILLALVLWCRRSTSTSTSTSGFFPGSAIACPYDRDLSEAVTSLADVVDDAGSNVCKLHRLPTGEYGYAHVWKVHNTQLPIANNQQKSAATPQHRRQELQQMEMLSNSQQHLNRNLNVTNELVNTCCNAFYAPKTTDDIALQRQNNQQQQLNIYDHYQQNSTNQSIVENDVSCNYIAEQQQHQQYQQQIVQQQQQQTCKFNNIIDNNNIEMECPLFNERGLNNSNIIINNNNSNNIDNDNNNNNIVTAVDKANKSLSTFKPNAVDLVSGVKPTTAVIKSTTNHQQQQHNHYHHHFPHQQELINNYM
ncbi:hypothetical protein HELRODRAFT_170947 [Helobdella robusta]|uniref:Uncharacterized protein n=1 Tax=Helobdella robusta TaxID=6412 RepID=T1F3M2_HELRO|nr:hypothetical protein HELRODRAFT_170947 [Helobdella robusta]ESO06912.1 hypothetical protein HELRODRAFT_170947 [Helobdella robusta]